MTLHIRSGQDSICAFRQEGAFPVKVMTMAAGDRRPLGIGSGPMALLAFLPDEEVEAIVKANAGRLERYPAYSAPVLFEMVEATRRQGYAFNNGVIFEDIHGVAVPIRGRDGKPMAAISIATIARRMQAERCANIVRWLTAEARKIEERIATLTAGLNGPGLQRFRELRSVAGGPPVAEAPGIAPG